MPSNTGRTLETTPHRFKRFRPAADLRDLLIAGWVHQQTPNGNGLHRVLHVGSAPAQPAGMGDFFG